jgi:GNAT superfamily N-acetyltransferase
MIRSITFEEIDIIKPLAEKIFAEAKYPGELNWETFTRFWGHVLHNSAGGIFIAEEGKGKLTGMVGALFVPGLFNGWQTTMLHFWYAVPKKRKTGLGKELFDKIEQEGTDRGSKVMIASHLFAINEDAMRPFFEKRGFKVNELGYRKIYG